MGPPLTTEQHLALRVIAAEQRTATLERRIALLERSMRELADVVAATVRTRPAHERMAVIVARHAEVDEAEDVPLDP